MTTPTTTRKTSSRTTRTPKDTTPKPTETATKTAPKDTTPAKATPKQDATPKAKEKTATDYRREVDLAIIQAAGNLVDEIVPAKLRKEVAVLIANQLHHLSTPKAGWPAKNLPKPDRSDWR